MSHVLAFKGQYFRVLVAEVVNADDPAKSGFVAWCSDGFRDLQELPSQELTRFVAGPPLATAAEKSSEITKIGITNNESPQYLTMWQRGK